MIISEKLLDGYENRKLVDYREIDKLKTLVSYDDLPKTATAGVLKLNMYVDGKLMQKYSDNENHVCVIAATRLGKTTSYVIPTILSFARQARKRSMIISDPKGEVYAITAETLRKEGYNVKLLNFRDYEHSECWNPLTPIFRKYRKAVEIQNEVTVAKTDKGYRNAFQGKTYEDMKELDNAVKRVRAMMIGGVENEINTLAVMIMPTNPAVQDPYWEDSARELFKAFLWAMLEDSDRKENPITEETYSFSTLIQLLLLMSASKESFNDNGYFTERDPASKAWGYAKNVIIENAGVTRSCIVSEYNSKVSPFRECAMRIITSCDSFKMTDFIERPTVLFINYRDEVKVHYQVISMFVQDAYRFLIDYATDKDSGKLDIPFYFILDEFGNFPRITDMEVTISACAGRNIFFILIIQSYAQLDNVYGRDTAEIIRDNLNVKVFLGSNNASTLEAFSQECGKKTRISPLSAINGSKEVIEHFQIETIPNVPVSALARIEPGECYVTEANDEYVLHSKLERYYMVDEMKDLPRTNCNKYQSEVNPFDSKYNYDVASIIRKQRRRD